MLTVAEISVLMRPKRTIISNYYALSQYSKDNWLDLYVTGYNYSENTDVLYVHVVPKEQGV